MNSFRGVEDESFLFQDPGSNLGRRGTSRFGSGHYGHPFSRHRRHEHDFSSSPWNQMNGGGLMEFEEEASDAGPWTGSSEQLAFREQVLNAHTARSKKRNH